MRSLDFRRVIELRNSFRPLSDDNIKQVRDISTFSSKLGRTEEIRRQGTTRVLRTLRISRTTTIDNVQIELQSFVFGIALQKIKILLPDEEVSTVDGVCGATRL